MGAVAYTSLSSDCDFYLAERPREQTELDFLMGRLFHTVGG